MRHPKHGWGVVLLAAQLAAAGALVVACADQPAGVDARFAAPGEARRDEFPAGGPNFFPPLHLTSTKYHVLNTEIGDTALTHAAPSTYGNEIHQFDTQWHNTTSQWYLFKDGKWYGPIKRVTPVGTTPISGTTTATPADLAEVDARGTPTTTQTSGSGTSSTGP
ncbi:MAG TPA: hypothetical protein VFR81_28110 [Longimicrobium sp.]|nr:hypothetical protein [Longimicrobium sp.]